MILKLFESLQLTRARRTPCFITLLVTVLTSACNNSAVTSHCEQFDGKWQAVFFGGFSGEGLVDISPLQDLGGVRSIRIMLQNFDEGGALTTSLSLNGTARCSINQLSAEFGGDAGQNNFFKVMGGNLAGSIDPLEDKRIYGIWSAEAVALEDLSIVSIQGFWSAKPEPFEN